MSEYVYFGQTSQTIDIFLQDSSSTTGAGLSGLVFNSAGLVASYRKGATGSRTAITLATQTVGGAYSSGGFVEIDATNMKGIYRLDLPNAMVDTEGFATLYIFGATNLLATALRIDCRPLPADSKRWNALPTVALPLIPTVAGRTLDVSATGEAGIDWANIGSPTSIQNLSATNIDVDQVVASVSGAVASVTAVSTGAITSGSFASNAITAASINAAALNGKGDWNIGKTGYALTATTGLGNQTANITGTITTVTTATNVTSVNGMAAGVITAGSIANGAIDAATFAADVDAEIAAMVWNAATASYGTAGTYGEALEAVGSSADPWLTNLPGAYGAGTAGKIIGDNINATISSRMATYTQPTGFLAATFPTDPADQSAVEAAITAATSPLATAVNLATVAGYLDTEIAAILADTNELQTDWVNGGRLDLILDSRSSQTSVDDVPTNAELATALGTADDAVLAAIAAEAIKTSAIAVVANKIGSVVFGTVTGAGTSTEVFVGAGITTTVTVDVDGNRSAVVFS